MSYSLAMRAHGYRYRLARTVDDALELLAAGGRVLAGGTDLLLQLGWPANTRPDSPRTLVDITRIPELRGVERRDGSLWVGALASFADVMRSTDVAAGCPLLVEAAENFAAPQIRSQATIVGNVMNASPAADCLSGLFALDAAVMVRGPRGEEARPIDQVVVGPRGVALAPGEICTGLLVPILGPGWGFHFIKFGYRSSLAIAVVSASAAVRVAGGRMADLRLGVGAVAPTPLRLRAIEEALRGLGPSSPEVDRAAARARDLISPIDDVRGSAWYRREITPVVLARAVREAARRSAAAQGMVPWAPRS